MSGATPMTLRIDPELKAAAEHAAAVAGTTLTDFVVSAMKQATNPRCGTCGRSSPSMTVGAAFTDAFTEFYNTLCKVDPQGRFVLFAEEGATRTVYWCRLRTSYLLEPGAGAVVVEAILNRTPIDRIAVDHDATYPLVIPRGAITGWLPDPDGRWYHSCCALAYADGNEPARRIVLAR